MVSSFGWGVYKVQRTRDRSQVLKRTSVFLRAALIPAIFIAQAAWASGPSVSDVGGRAWLRPEGASQWRALKADDPLEPGDMVRVQSGRVSIVNASGDAMELDEGAEMEIGPQTETESLWALLVGRLLASARPGLDRKFQIETPVAVAAVRGTVFALDVDEEGATDLAVEEGRVEFGGSPLQLIGVQSGMGARLAGQRLETRAALSALERKRFKRAPGLRSRANRFIERASRRPPHLRADERSRLMQRRPARPLPVRRRNGRM